MLAQFRERKSRATFAGIGFLLAQFRERKSLQLLLELLGVLIACPCKGADRRPAFRPRPRRCEAKPNCRERKKARKSRATFAGIGFLLAQFRERKSRATFAGIGFLLAQFRERKSLQLLLELLGVLIACPCKGADRRPAFRPRPRRCEAKPNCRERKKARKSRATFAGIGFLLAQFRERKSRATFAGIAFNAGG